MDACERYEIALEMERAGALGPAEARELEAHLLTCPACRAARDLLAEQDRALRGAEVEPASGWDDLRARLERTRRMVRRQLLLGMVLAVAFGAALLAGRHYSMGHAFDAFGAGLATGIGFALAVVALRWWRLLRATPALPTEELLRRVRRQLERKARAIRFLAPIFPVYLAILVFVTPARIWGEGPRGLALQLVLVAAAVALALYSRLRVLPRVRRELANLEGRA